MCAGHSGAQMKPDMASDLVAGNAEVVRELVGYMDK